MNLIDTIFTIINCTVLVAVFVFFFRRYIIPATRSDIAQEQERMQHLSKQCSHLEQELRRARQLTTQAERECCRLHAHVRMWRDAVEDQNKKADERARAYCATLSQRYEQQRIFLAMQRLQSRDVSQAFTEARLELYELFQESQHGERYVQQVVRSLRRRNGSSS